MRLAAGSPALVRRMAMMAAPKDRRAAQWLIIHGRVLAKVLPPSAVCRVLPADRLPPQHPQFIPCPPRVLRGSLALRSFMAWARFTADDKAPNAGAPATMRPDGAPQRGQGDGSRHCARGRMAAKSPHCPQE
jgi:hypothetical protein